MDAPDGLPVAARVLRLGPRDPEVHPALSLARRIPAIMVFVTEANPDAAPEDQVELAGARPDETGAQPAEPGAQPAESGTSSDGEEEGALEEHAEEPEPSGDAILDALWTKTLQSWEDDKPHAALLEYAIRQERLPDLAGLYRGLRDDPQRGELAKKKLDGIVVAATQMLFAMKTPRPTKTPFWMLASAFATCAILLGWLAYAILRPQ